MFENLAELLRALGDDFEPTELAQVQQLAAAGLPPVVSRSVLGTMFGLNPGLIWSFEHRPSRHYRSFTIPKGRSERRIDAPRVALKIIQKWISVQLQLKYVPQQHVHGFVSGTSHVIAAQAHVGAHWVLSVDIKDFFQSTPRSLVLETLKEFGFLDGSAELISRLTCLRDALAQGAPSSPVLSNMCFIHVDRALGELAARFNVRLSRYADDIVFSGTDPFPDELLAEVVALFELGPWRLADHKTQLASLPDRLKVHGLLVHGQQARLTKGYRNRLRAYRHLLANHAIALGDLRKVKGHLAYGEFVDGTAQADESLRPQTFLVGSGGTAP